MRIGEVKGAIANLAFTPNTDRLKELKPTIDDNYFVSEMAGIPSANIVDYRIRVRPMGYGPFHHTHADNMSIIDRNTLNEVGSTVLSVVYEP